MRRISMIAMILGGVLLGASLPGVVGRARRPVAPATGSASVVEPSTPAAVPASRGELAAMLEVGRKARLQPAAPAAAQRRAREEAIARGPADARGAALRTLALEDRDAADAIARRRLGDHVLFADAARLLLIRPDGSPDSADVARVREALRTGDHDEASRAAVSSLVLETLVQARSPAVSRFAATLQRDPSRRVQAAAVRFVGPAPRTSKPRRPLARG